MFFFAAAFVFYTPAPAAGIAAVSRSGRSIQLDGFLVDWKEKERRTWQGSDQWCWDAVNTPEGLAGYFHNAGDRCKPWTFYIDARNGALRPRIVSVDDTGVETGRNFAYTSLAVDSSAFCLTLEWVIPWDSLAVDSAGTYTVSVAGRSACGDTLQSLLLTGVHRNRGRPAHEAALWGVLAAVSAAVLWRIRKKRRRRESLRR